MLSNSNLLKKRIIKGLGANAYGQLVTIGIQLLSVPLFLHYWGSQKYGEWLILVAIPAYLSLSDVGFATVAGNQMSMEVAKGDQNSALETYQSSWLLISILSVFVFFLIYISLHFIPVAGIFKLKSISQNDAGLVLLFLSLQVLVSLQGGMVSAGFRAIGHYAKGAFFSNSIRLFEWALAAIVLIYGGEAVEVSCALLIGRMISTLYSMYCMKKNAPWLVMGLNKVDREVIRKLIKPASGLMAFSLSQAISIQGIVLIVGYIFGPSSVVVFSTYRTLSRLLVQGVTLVNQALWPEMSTAYGQGNLALVRKLHRKGFCISFWLGVFSVIALILFGDYLVRLWLGSVFLANFYLLLILLIVSMFNIGWQSSWVVLMAINEHSGISNIYLLSTLIVVVGMVCFGSYLSVEYLAAMLIFAELPLLCYAILRATKLTKDSVSQFLISIVKIDRNY